MVYPVLERVLGQVLIVLLIMMHGVDQSHHSIVTRPQITLDLGEHQVPIAINLEGP